LSYINQNSLINNDDDKDMRLQQAFQAARNND